MFWENNRVVTRFKEKIPNIFVLRCICHSAHLCASHSCEKLPRTAEELLHDIYNYFSHSAKRQAEFLAFQEFAEVEPHKLLPPTQTHYSCVSSKLNNGMLLSFIFKQR